MLATPSEPRIGEVWWCAGDAVGLNDGGKTRPVLITGWDSDAAEVVPLTSRKPTTGQPISVAHRGGLSWMAGNAVRRVPKIALISSLGIWAGYAAWKRQSS